METTTIQVSRELKALLDDAKIHPRETYEDIIMRLIKFSQYQVVKEEYRKFEKQLLEETRH